MEYTILKLARLAGISTRTLRYYDEIGILKPARISSSGYRIYGEQEVNRLQQILFYRELDVSLDLVKNIMTSKTFDGMDALREHHEKLLEKKNRLELLIDNVEKTISSLEGRINMTNQEKFTGFKKQLIDENEKQYGNEIRIKYGDTAVNKSNAKLKNMTEEQYNHIQSLANEIMMKLKEAFKLGDPGSPIAQEVATLHREWISFYWDSYSKEAHAGLAQMYVDDERFTKYYDEEQPGLAAFLRDSIFIYTGTK